MDNDIVRRLIWTGLLAGAGAVASILAHKIAATIYIRVFDEDPPE